MHRIDKLAVSAVLDDVAGAEFHGKILCLLALLDTVCEQEAI